MDHVTVNTGSVTIKRYRLRKVSSAESKEPIQKHPAMYELYLCILAFVIFYEKQKNAYHT